MKKERKEFTNTDYLAELRRNNMYGVSYYNNIENEFAREENLDLENEYYRQDEAKSKSEKKECGCTCNKKSEAKSKEKRSKK